MAILPATVDRLADINAVLHCRDLSLAADSTAQCAIHFILCLTVWGVEPDVTILSCHCGGGSAEGALCTQSRAQSCRIKKRAGRCISTPYKEFLESNKACCG